MDIDASDGVAGESFARNRERQRATLGPRAFRRSRKSLRGDLAILDVEQRADQHDFAAEIALEEIFIVLRRAGIKVGERIGRDVVGAACEIEREHIRRLARQSREYRIGGRLYSAPDNPGS